MNWIFYALTATFMFAALDLGMRVTAQHAKNERAFSFVYNMWGVLSAFVIFVIQEPKLDITPIFQPNVLPTILFASLLYGVFERLQFIARKRVEASTLAIVFGLIPVTAFVSAILFVGESVTISKIVGLLLTVGASLSVVSKNFKIDPKGLQVGLLCSVVLGMAWTSTKFIAAGVSASLITFAIWTFPIIFIYAPSIPLKDILYELKQGSWKLVILAILNVAGYNIQLKAMAVADASQVIPIISSGTVFVVLGGMLLLKERDHVAKKILASIIAVIGIYFLRR